MKQQMEGLHPMQAVQVPPARVTRKVLLSEKVLVFGAIACGIGYARHPGLCRHRHVPSFPIAKAESDARFPVTPRYCEFPTPDMALTQRCDVAGRNRQHYAVRRHIRRFSSTIKDEQGGNPPAFALHTPEMKDRPDDLAAFFLRRKRHTVCPAVSGSFSFPAAQQVKHAFGHRFVQDAVINAVKLLDMLAILLEEGGGFYVGLDHQLYLPPFLVVK